MDGMLERRTYEWIRTVQVRMEAGQGAAGFMSARRGSAVARGGRGGERGARGGEGFGAAS